MVLAVRQVAIALEVNSQTSGIAERRVRAEAVRCAADQRLAGQALVSGTSNGFGTNASFSDPAGLTVDLKGNCYLADSQNHAVRKIDPKGIVSTLAGELGTRGTRNGT